MSGTIRLCRVDEVDEGAPIAADVPGLPPLAIFRVGDALHVTSNRCTHGAGLLTEGEQTGAIIECPIHSGTFDVTTGEAIDFPCRVALQTFPVTVEEGWVCVSNRLSSIAAPKDSDSIALD